MKSQASTIDCAHCGSITNRCYRCGYTWHPRKKNTLSCPSCHNPNWDKPKVRDYMFKSRRPKVEKIKVGDGIVPFWEKRHGSKNRKDETPNGRVGLASMVESDVG